MSTSSMGVRTPAMVGAACFALLALLLAASSSPAWGDTVYLKNGSAIDGTVLGTNEGMVILGIGNVGRMEIPEADIENIEKNDRTGYVDPGRGEDGGREVKGGELIRPDEPDDGADKGGDGTKSGGGAAADDAGDEPEELDPNLVKEIEELATDLTRQKTTTRVRAERRLHAIGAPIVPYILKYSRHPFVRTRVAVYRLYKDFGGFEIAEPCLEGLEDEDRFVRQLAWQALKRVAHKSWDFPWDDEEATDEERERATDRWRKWYQEEKEKREAAEETKPKKEKEKEPAGSSPKD